MPTRPRAGGGAIADLLPWLCSILLTLFMLRLALAFGDFGTDSHAYWLTGHVDDLYRTGPATEDAYLYSPAFAQAIWPLTWLPWIGFALTWLALQTAALVWLVRPLSLPWAWCLAMVCVPELLIGNINLFLAVVTVVGIRYPAVWAFGILTKLTPGLGLLWFLVRGDWRRLYIASAVTLGIVLASYVMAPEAWARWVEFTAGNRNVSGDGSEGLLIRFAMAAVLVTIGARSDRPWVLAIAVLIASPVLNTISALALLAAIPRLLASRRGSESSRQEIT